MLPDVLIENFGYLLRGAVMTVGLAAATIVPSAVIGMVLALAKVFGGIGVRAAVDVYLYVIRGVPLCPACATGATALRTAIMNILLCVSIAWVRGRRVHRRERRRTRRPTSEVAKAEAVRKRRFLRNEPNLRQDFRPKFGLTSRATD